MPFLPAAADVCSTEDAHGVEACPCIYAMCMEIIMHTICTYQKTTPKVFSSIPIGILQCLIAAFIPGELIHNGR